MPESEPKPRLIELVAPGGGQGWKAVLKNGKQVVVHEIPVPAAEAAAAVPRIQRLAEHRHPALSPVEAWGTDANGIWVAVEPNEGVPLGTVLSRGPLTPPAAAALGAAVLSGVAALHEDGIAMGGFNSSAIRITSNGEVRLAGHPAAAVRGAPAQSDLRADVRSCGMAICAAFGVDPAGAPAPPNIPPGLVVTMRSMASGAMGPAADRAQGALREMASALLSPDRLTAAQSELATRAGGREMPSITPFLPKEPPTPAAPPPAAYVPPVPREDTPIRAPVSYEAPPRPAATWSSPPTPAVPPAAPAPAPSWSSPPAPATPPASSAPPPGQTSPPVPAPSPTWSDVPPRTPSPFEASPAATNPPAPAAEPPASAPRFEPPPPAAPAPRYEPPAPSPRYEPPAPSPTATNPPAPAKPTWTAISSGVWTPAETEGATSAGAAGAAGTAAGASASSTASKAAPASERAPARQTLPRRPAAYGAGERPRWLIPAAIAILLILLLTGGVIFAASRGTSTGPTATASPSPRTSPKTSPKTSPNATPTAGAIKGIPNYAPAAADPITSAQFCTVATPCHAPGLADATDTSCTLNGACTIDVGIYYTYPPGYGGPIKFGLKFFDRCTGETKDVSGFSATAGNSSFPKFAVSEVGGPVTLPTGAKAAYLIAVTSAPSTVQSAALQLGADTCA